MSSTLGIVFLFLLGIVFTVKGGDFFVDAASWIAEISGIPKFLIGATIVSIATTMPELLVSLMAAAKGSNGIAIGNAVGSVTANLGLIMGISIVCMPAIISRRQYAFNFLMMLLAIAVLYGFSFGGALQPLSSILLLVMFAVYFASSIRNARTAMGNTATNDDRPPHDRGVIIANIIKFTLGAAGIVCGAQLLVSNGSAIARIFGVPESIIGATLVAIGTSLPELVTTITAIVKKQSSLSIGNIVGANIIDLTIILPLCGLISGKPIPMLRQNIMLDMPFCLFLVLIAIAPTLISGKFRKAQGVFMLLMYAVYIVLMCTGLSV